MATAPRDPRSTSAEHAIAQRLADFVRAMDCAVVVGDADGRVEWVNDAFVRLAGVPEGELLGERLCLHPDDADAEDALVARVREALASGETARHEVSVPGRPGRRLRLALEVHGVRGDDGRLEGFVARATDVTEARRAQSAVAESEERYRTLVELSPEPIAVHCRGRVVFVNAAALQLLGAQGSDDVIGRPILELVHPDFHGMVSERVLKMEASGEPVTLAPEHLVRVDGTTVEVELAAAPVLWNGEPAIQIVARDVTERRRIEAERRALEERLREAQRQQSLVALAGGVARDFGGFLDTILGRTDQLLIELGDDALSAGPVREIRSAALQAASLTGRMQAFAGRPKNVSAAVDLSRLVIDLSQRIDNAASRRATLTYDLTGSLPHVDGDPTQLREVVTTLLANASEALRGGAGTILVRTGSRVLDAEDLARFTASGETAPGRYVLLDVTDSGCGMDAATQARIFDPFFSTHFPGSGLGLSAAFGIVRSHGGAMRVESELGRGTRITVALPALPGAEEPSPTSSEATAAASDRPRARSIPRAPARAPRRRAKLEGRPLVLVVDDEAGIRNMARRVLERAGFQVVMARDGREAVDLYRTEHERIAAVLLDLTMPRLSGDGALRELAGIRADVRVVLSSGYAGPEVLERLRDLPVAAFLKKPYDAASLADVLHAVVSGEV